MVKVQRHEQRGRKAEAQRQKQKGIDVLTDLPTC